MRILFDITHPAHLHFFKAAITQLRRDGHEVKLIGREKDILTGLARELGFEMEVFGGTPKGVLGMAATLIARQRRIARIVREFSPDVMAAIGGTFIALVGRVLSVPVVVFYDTESATLSNAITYPFVTRLCTPRSYSRPDRRGQVRYEGHHERAYLAPAYFSPDPTVLDELGVRPGEPYTIVRFVGWGASHDLGRDGLSGVAKRHLVTELSRRGRVFISTEGELPPELEPHRYRLPVHRMHHAMAHARLVVGESSTMSAEAAVLGVPSVYVYPLVELGCITELAERWKIIHWFPRERFEQAIEKSLEIIDENDNERWGSIAAEMDRVSDDVPRFVREQILAFAGPAEARPDTGPNPP